MGLDNIGKGCALKIVFEFVALAILLLAGGAGAATLTMNASGGNKVNIKRNIMKFITVSFLAVITVESFLVVMPIASATLEYSQDNDTVLLDHFNGSTLAEYTNGTLNYVEGLPGLNKAAGFRNGTWIRYALSGWYQWSSVYNPDGKEGTVDIWVYPRKYGLGLLTFQWNRVNSPPVAGYILHFQINSDGKLVGGVWSAISGGPVDSTLPSGKTTIPLNTWTHVAFTWSPTGTKLYVNGKIDAESQYNLYPALNSQNYVYVNYWGDSDLGYVDELRISKVARTEFAPTDTAPTISGTTTANISYTSADITFTVNQSDSRTRVYYGTTESLGEFSNWNNYTGLSRTIALSNLSEDTKYYYSIYAYNGSNPSYFSNSSIQSFTTKSPPPTILSFTPESPVIDTTEVARAFNIKVNQIVNFTWYINGTEVFNQTNVNQSTYTNTSAALGTWNVTAMVSNSNGSAMKTWDWIVTPIPTAGSISGFKINDTNGNGKWDAGENGISNWTIRLIGITGKGKNAKVIRKETFTDAMGFYKFDNLSAGKYFVIEKLKKGFVPKSSPVNG